MSDDVVNAVCEGDAVDERALQRLAHDAVDVTIATVGSEQVHFIAKHGFYFFSILLCKGNDLSIHWAWLAHDSKYQHRLRVI